MKKCPRCGEVKPLTDFGTNRTTKDGLSYWCGDCKRSYGREYYAKHPKLNRASPQDRRRNSLLNNYGITPEQWDWLLAGQNDQCAICGDEILPIATYQQSAGRKAAVTDHCHETGEVRGLLCSPCNTGLGAFRDDPSIVISAYAYLNSFRELSHAPNLCVGPRDERPT